MRRRMRRRGFLQSAAAGALAVGARAPLEAGEPTTAAGTAVYREPARDLPVVETTEVLVAGGGPAGLAAAIAAARAGAKTCLLEASEIACKGHAGGVG